MKSPDEIKKGLECCMDHNGTCEDCPYVEGECRAFAQLSEDALALIQQMEKQNRCLREIKESFERRMIDLAERMPSWINAKDSPKKWRLDDKEHTLVNYLVYMPEYGVDVGNYIEPAHRWVVMGLPAQVTHWMPMPEPPKTIN